MKYVQLRMAQQFTRLETHHELWVSHTPIRQNDPWRQDVFLKFPLMLCEGNKHFLPFTLEVDAETIGYGQ